MIILHNRMATSMERELTKLENMVPSLQNKHNEMVSNGTIVVGQEPLEP